MSLAAKAAVLEVEVEVPDPADLLGPPTDGGLVGSLGEEPLARIGIIADIQYAGRDDVGVSFWGRQRFYADGVNKAGWSSRF